ncbi:MAG: hypothetical protein Q9195_003576 [Heterodermia aff. obscurata]
MTGIEIAGLALAAPAVIRECFELGDKLAKKVRENKESKAFAAKAIARDLDVLEKPLEIFNTDIGRTQLKLDMEQGKLVLKDPAVAEEDKNALSDVFEVATRSLKKIDCDVEIIQSNAFALYSRSRNKAYRDMKTELTTLETKMSKFRSLVMALRNVQISESSLYLEDHDFQIIGGETGVMRLNESAFVTKGRPARDVRQARKGTGLFLFDAKQYTPNTKGSLKKDFRFLSERLASTIISGGILPFVGFRDGGDEFQFVFQAPSSVDRMLSLQSTMQTAQDQLPSLNAKLSICCQLAEAVLHVHTLGLVHKNIRPDNVLVVFPEADLAFHGSADPQVFLLGWERARQVDDNHTNLEGENLWERSLYQHPERWSDEGREVQEFCMGHDIYSLAVCMLEILTWEPLVLPSPNSTRSDVEPVVGKCLVEAFAELQLSTSSRPRAQFESDGAWVSQDALNVQKMLLQLAGTRLPSVAGRRITDLVQRSLCCLDPDAGFAAGISFEKPTGKEVGLDFIDSVLGDLRDVTSVI